MKSVAATALADAIEKVAKTTKRPAVAKSNETDLEIVESEILAVRRSLELARTDGNGGRTATLLGELRKLMEARRELRPPPPPTADDEERRWRASADRVLRKIEQGVLEAEAMEAKRG